MPGVAIAREHRHIRQTFGGDDPLERLVAEKDVADAATQARYAAAWGRAADRTPHGTPIELAPADFA